MTGFYVVQRLSRAWEGNSKKGFDSWFELEYMGAAEYEFTTPNDALKRMRAKPFIVFHHEVYSVQGQPLEEPVHAFFIGHKAGLLEKLDEFAKWLDKPRSKVQTHFPENVTGVDWKGDPIDEYYKRTVAWWSFHDDLAWTLDPQVAADLIKAFEPA